MIKIIMGSQSDWNIVKEASIILKELEIKHECRVLSAHRTPHELMVFLKNSETQGTKIFIAAAGAAAHQHPTPAARTGQGVGRPAPRRWSQRQRGRGGDLRPHAPVAGHAGPSPGRRTHHRPGQRTGDGTHHVRTGDHDTDRSTATATAPAAGATPRRLWPQPCPHDPSAAPQFGSESYSPSIPMLGFPVPRIARNAVGIFFHGNST